MRRNAGGASRRVVAAAMSTGLVGTLGLTAIGVGSGAAHPVAHAGVATGAARPVVNATGVDSGAARPVVHAAGVAGIAGVVVNSQGHPLPGLAITLSGQIPSGRIYDFRARTDNHGRFRLGSAAGRLDVVKWTASAAFRWYGGVWNRTLNTLSGSPTHLTFQADVIARGHNSLATGVVLRIDDWDGCDSLAASDPSFVATDPGTQSISLRLTPARSLVDGSEGRAGTVTLRSGALCGLEGEGHQITVPAGAWKVTGVTNHGRALAFSTHLGNGPYERSLTTFDFPMSSSETVETIDVHFA